MTSRSAENVMFVRSDLARQFRHCVGWRGLIQPAHQSRDQQISSGRRRRQALSVSSVVSKSLDRRNLRVPKTAVPCRRWHQRQCRRLDIAYHKVRRLESRVIWAGSLGPSIVAPRKHSPTSQEVLHLFSYRIWSNRCMDMCRGAMCLVTSLEEEKGR